jgi:hypothetical protein
LCDKNGAAPTFSAKCVGVMLYDVDVKISICDLSKCPRKVADLQEEFRKIADLQEEFRKDFPFSLLLSTLWLPGIKLISLLLDLRIATTSQHLDNFARQTTVTSQRPR